MRLAIISDLHLDINHFDSVELTLLADILQEINVNHLHLAGDTANKVEKVIETVTFLEQHGISVTYNFGNHEMPNLLETEIENYPERHFLNFNTVALGEDKVLLAFNGWYDYSYATETDIKKIVSTKNLYWYDRFIKRGADDPTITQQLLTALKIKLDQLQNAGKEVVIATHFVPKREFIVYQKGKYARWNELNAFLGSDKTGQLLDQYANISLVVFGHTHRRFGEKKINGITYACRPFGYYFEWALTRQFVIDYELVQDVNPMKLRSILKDNQKDFDQYKQFHLKEEFRKALTLYDY